MLLTFMVALIRAVAQQAPAPATPVSTNLVAISTVETNLLLVEPFDTQVSAPAIDLEPKSAPGNLITETPKSGNKILSAPMNLLKDVSPLAPPERTYTPPAPRRGGPSDTASDLKVNRKLSPRAWTTTVGWYPGNSAFPNDIYHWP